MHFVVTPDTWAVRNNNNYGITFRFCFVRKTNICPVQLPSGINTCAHRHIFFYYPCN